MAYYIHSKDIELIRKEIINNDKEACGYLLTQDEFEIKKPHPKELIFYLESYGEKNMSQVKEYTKYIWHTHPEGENGYPSYQDVVNMLKFHSNNFKNNNPICSVIFSTWGIWEINSREKFQLDDAWTEYLNETVKQAGDTLFDADKKNNRQQGIKDYIKKIETTINTDNFLNKAKTDLIRLTFTPWSNIRDYSLRLGEQIR